MGGRQRPLQTSLYIAGTVVAVFRREGMGTENGVLSLRPARRAELASHPQHLEFGFDIEPVAGLDFDRRDAFGEQGFEPILRQPKNSSSAAARVAFTVETIPPPALAISA